MTSSEQDVVMLDESNPVERVFADCVRVFRERSLKYTHGQWDDNFQYIARKMRERGHEFTAADAATVLMLVKEARQDAARKSGRTDFADDSYRDSKVDDINYRAIQIALEDQESGLEGVLGDLDGFTLRAEEEFGNPGRPEK